MINKFSLVLRINNQRKNSRREVLTDNKCRGPYLIETIN